MRTERLDPDALLRGDRRTLARALSLTESSRDSEHADELTSLLSAVAGRRTSVRVTVAGPPGAGKSSLINVLGVQVCRAGRSVAVLAVDPRSPRTGGSVLGDKIRMAELVECPQAYVRPVACQMAFGGVFTGWYESLLLCEAAGFDMVVTETIGVGQGETVSAQLADVYVVALAPGLGDEIQGLKRGAMELADVLVVTKADGATTELAKSTAREYKQAMSIYGGRVAGRGARVFTVSARTGTGLDDLAAGIDEVWNSRDTAGRDQHRRRGLRDWTTHQVIEQFARRVADDQPVRRQVDAVLDRVEKGDVTATNAAADILAGLMTVPSNRPD